jgi:hypothetical protein
MIAIDSREIESVGIALGAALLYSLSFWRIFKQNPGNRLVECGYMTLMVFYAIIPLTRFDHIPDRLFASWLILLILHCFATLFFAVQRWFGGPRHRKDPCSAPSRHNSRQIGAAPAPPAD